MGRFRCFGALVCRCPLPPIGSSVRFVCYDAKVVVLNKIDLPHVRSRQAELEVSIKAELGHTRFMSIRYGCTTWSWSWQKSMKSGVPGVRMRGELREANSMPLLAVQGRLRKIDFVSSSDHVEGQCCCCVSQADMWG